MVTRLKILYIFYMGVVLLFFGVVDFYLSTDKLDNIPTFVNWIGIPGVLLSACCLVGIHSDYFILVSILANIAVYLLAPFLFWKIGKRVKSIIVNLIKVGMRQ